MEGGVFKYMCFFIFVLASNNERPISTNKIYLLKLGTKFQREILDDPCETKNLLCFSDLAKPYCRFYNQIVVSVFSFKLPTLSNPRIFSVEKRNRMLFKPRWAPTHSVLSI